ncbi:MAG: hypothetical protein ACREJC_02935 [Tepidisphaeraceae bacterium]
MLKRATWPAPMPGAIARLQRAAVVAHQSRRLTILRIAASVALVSALGAWIIARFFGTPDAIGVGRITQVTPATTIGRDPTALEWAMIRSMEKRQPATRPAIAKATTVRSNLPEARQTPAPRRDVDAIAVQLRGSGGEDQRQLLAELLGDGSPAALRVYLGYVADERSRSGALRATESVPRLPVDALLGFFDDGLVQTRLAAARVLGYVDGPDITRRLAEMALRNQNRREALIALSLSRGAEAQEFVRVAELSGPLAPALRSVRIQEIH